MKIIVICILLALYTLQNSCSSMIYHASGVQEKKVFPEDAWFLVPKSSHVEVYIYLIVSIQTNNIVTSVPYIGREYQNSSLLIPLYLNVT